MRLRFGIYEQKGAAAEKRLYSDKKVNRKNVNRRKPPRGPKSSAGMLTGS